MSRRVRGLPGPFGDAVEAAARLGSSARDQAEAVGRKWALSVRQEVVDSSRRPSGGWPGTISEARSHVAFYLLPWLAEQKGVAITLDERESAARFVYAVARATWLEHSERVEDHF